MQFSMRMTKGEALNWDVYEPVNKDGTSDTCDSTSAGSSDSESGDHGSSVSDESFTEVETIPFYGELCSAMAMVWIMGSMNYPQCASKFKRQRLPRGRAVCAVPAPVDMPSCVPPVFAPPPGLEAPTDLSAPPPPGLQILFPPGLGGAPKRLVSTDDVYAEIKDREGPFDLKMFRKEMVATLRELSVQRNVARAVRRMRAQRVPAEYQAAEFADVLTRAAEEPRGGTRRLWWAFAAGLGAGLDSPDGSAFGRAECEAGLKIFFQDTYPGLCEEIHRLPVAAKAELIPTLQYVFSKEVMRSLLPTELC